MKNNNPGLKRLTGYITLLLLAFAPAAYAQDDGPIGNTDVADARFLIHVNGAVPHGIGNVAFKRSFTGIYDVSSSFNVRLFSGFTVGISGRFNQFKTTDNKIPGLNTYAQIIGGGGRISYYHFLKETTAAYGGVNVGFSNIHYTGLSCLNNTQPEKTKSNARYIEPELGILFFIEGDFSIGLHTSLPLYNYQFDPYAICLNQHKAYLDSDRVGNLRHLNFGFSVSYAFLKK